MAAEAYTEEQLLRRVWHEPDLSYLLHKGQQELREAWRSSTSTVWVARVARRWGKSWAFCVDAVEEALGGPERPIIYAAQTQKEAENIVAPHMRQILADCPEELAPRFVASKLRWEFRNGSTITLGGCDDERKADRFRGRALYRGYGDEAGFNPVLRYLLQSVLLPQTATTDGRIAVFSSPAKTPAHYFRELCAEAEAAGELFHRTIYDAPHLTPETVERLIADAGGITSTEARREYLAEDVLDDEHGVVPEFGEHEKELVQALEVPPYRDCYVVGDLGYVDLSVLLFCYYDFRRARLVIEDELVFRNASTSDIVPVAKAKEAELWGDQAPYLRLLDGDPATLAEYAAQGYSAGACTRADLEGAVNDLRVQTVRHQYAIHPRCTKLQAHLKYAVWNKARSGFSRMDGFGHFDGVAAMMYAVRHVSRQRNPYPKHGGATSRTHWIPPPQPTEQERALVSMIKPRRKR